MDQPREHAGAFDPSGISRPAPVLLRYYTVCSLFTLIAFPVVWLVHFFKYETMRYRFDDDGVSMAWGILFRREVNLTYRRIQDIHLTRNIIQRWMGLATVSVQTASGSSTPEMQIEGVLEFEALRDYLYAKMRGAKGLDEGTEEMKPDAASPNEAVALLHEIRDDLAAVRRSLEGRAP